MRKLFKFLDRTKLSVPLILVLKSAVERMGHGFKFKRLNMIAVGQSHLDAAWRWRKKQTILKARATFSKAIQHMKEHPQFTFAQPSPAYYAWMKQYFPKLYEEMKAAVKNGQWVLFGGMWVEPDLNLPSGESLVRQRLYGMRFYLQEFGKMPDIEFLQDVFGFSYSLPQILAKSGCKLFGTGKIFWNDTNKFPLGMFHWQSPDGTTLPTLLIHFGYFLPINYGKEYPYIYKLMKSKTKPGIEPIFDYTTPEKDIRAAQCEEIMLNTIFGYGLGDGGHGPVEAEITAVDAFKLLYPKRFNFYRDGMFFRHFEPYLDRWATWNSEIYLEFHRGVYTTNSKMKWYNRKMEILLEDCEKACTVAALLGMPYPRAQITECWKAVLFNQFHDILPGSSIYEVYQDAFADYEGARTMLDGLMQSAVEHVISATGQGSAKSGTVLSLYNALSWPRTDLAEIPDDTIIKAGIAIDDLVEARLAQNIEKGMARGVLIPVSLKPASISSTNGERLKAMAIQASLADKALGIIEESEHFLLENEKLAVTIDKNTGYVLRIYQKQLDIESLAGPANKILLFGDHPKHFDAWEIDHDYLKNPVAVDDACKSIKVIERGPLRAGVEIVHEHGSSKFIQRVFLQARDDLVRFSMDVDWHEQKTIFKLAFPVAINGDQVVSEIPYACISRPINPKTPREKARWEYNGQKWLDISDGKVGIGLLNDCKYGFSMAGNEIRFTVLNSPVYAGYAKETVFVNRDDPSIPKYVDQFLHENIQYALYVHSGTWQEGTWRKAIEFNDPIRASAVASNETKAAAKLPVAIDSFESCTPGNVVISTWKVHEDEPNLDAPSTLVLRAVELGGIGPVDATVTLPGFVKIREAIEVDMLELVERGSEAIKVQGNKISFRMGKYEIKTLKVRIQAPA